MNIFQINLEDGLPQGICYDCSKIFENTFNFIEKCKSSDAILRSALDEKDLIENSTENLVLESESLYSCDDYTKEGEKIENSDEEVSQGDQTNEDIEKNEFQSNRNHPVEKHLNCECCGEKFC